MVIWLAHGVQMGAGGSATTPAPTPMLPTTGAGQ